MAASNWDGDSGSMCIAPDDVMPAVIESLDVGPGSVVRTPG
jgi:hypothetical protein